MKKKTQTFKIFTLQQRNRMELQT